MKIIKIPNNKDIKIHHWNNKFNGNQYVKRNRVKKISFMDKAKLAIRNFFRKLFIVTSIAFVGYVIFMVGYYSMPQKVITQIVKADEVNKVPPVMQKIAKCESSTGHYAKNGQVVARGNKNGSSDIGKYQINQAIWGKKATEMKLNLMVEEDNEAFALWLYENKGTEPWFLSKSCWLK